MLKDVAVVHEGALAGRRVIERDEKFSLVFNEHNVFPAGEVRRRHRCHRNDHALSGRANVERASGVWRAAARSFETLPSQHAVCIYSKSPDEVS
jgi:hypothetical protein